MGKPRDTKVAILPSTTRKGTTLSTSAALDSPSVISQLVSPPQTSRVGTSAESENSSDNFDDASTVLDNAGSLGPFLDATIARSRQIEITETPNENTVTPVNSPEIDDLDEDYVELDDDFIDKCNATTSTSNLKKLIAQHAVRYKPSPDPKFSTSPINIKDKDYDFSLDLSHISIVEKTPFVMRTYFVAKIFPFSLKDDAKIWKRTPDEAEELLAKISKNHDDWSTPEPTPTPILKKRGMIELNDEDMREAKKSLMEKGIKSEDVKNLPPIEDLCKIIPPSSTIEYMKDIVSNKRKIPNEEISTMLANYSFNGKVPKKLGDPDKLIPTDISLQMADKSTAIPVGVCENVPIQVTQHCLILTDFVVLEMPEDDNMSIILGRPFLNTAGAVIDCNKGKVTFNVDDKEHTVYFPKRIDKVYGVNTIFNVKTIKVGSIDCPIYEPKEEYQTLVIGSISIQYKKRKMNNYNFGEVFEGETTSTGRPSRASTRIRRSYNEDVIAPSFVDGNGDPNASSFPCYEFLSNAGLLDDFLTLIGNAGLTTYMEDEGKQYYMLTKIFVESFKFNNKHFNPTVAFKIYGTPVTMELKDFCAALGIAPAVDSIMDNIVYRMLFADGDEREVLLPQTDLFSIDRKPWSRSKEEVDEQLKIQGFHQQHDSEDAEPSYDYTVTSIRPKRSFLDATIAKSRQIENTEIPNENAATPVNSPESVEYSSDDLDEDYVELDDDFIEKCNATTDARKIKKLLAEHAVKYKPSPDPKFSTSPINIRDKDYDFSLDLSHIAIVEKTPFCGTEKESAVEHLTEKRTPDDAEELLAKIGRNHDDWSTPEPTPTPIVKKRGMIKLNDEDMREAKKSLKEKGIKPEDVKNLPPIEDLCEITPPSSMIEDPLYPEGHPKRVEQDSQLTKTSAPSKKKKKKHKNVIESSEPVNDPNSISISDAETESGNEHEEDNDKNDTPDKEEIEKEPEKPAKNKKYTKEDFITEKHGAVIDCNKGMVTFNVDDKEHTVYFPKRIDKKGKMKKFKFGELFKKATTSTGRPSRASTQIRRSYNEDVIAPSFAPEEDNGAPNGSSFPCYEFLTNAGILDDFFTLVNRAGLA
ncbi:hypothetical protein QYE76_016830 [Lolium multiflorum]|uniref:Reverse transcriptase domain-containing protein n=1 Tax=Lolium multiflorum TaxID=4521 RepID=A0AAD8VF09_LOLMU|nr:hypothetical protein QYE76_016830 [Lolium multiflorum]